MTQILPVLTWTRKYGLDINYLLSILAVAMDQKHFWFVNMDVYTCN